MNPSAEPDEIIKSSKLSLIAKYLPFTLFAIAFSDNDFVMTLNCVSLAVIESNLNSLIKVKDHRIRGLLTETSLYFIILCFGLLT